MKKLFLTASFMLSTWAFSQLNFVAEAGYLNSQLSFNPESTLKPESKSGYYAGLGMERKWGERIAMQLDFHYVNSGAQYKAGNETVTLNMNRLQIPLTLRYYATYELALFAGGYLDMKLFNSVKTTSGNALLQDTMKNYLDKELDGLNYGIHLGADYKIHKGFYISGRYNLGLGNLVNKSIRNRTNQEVKINFFQIGIGYKFYE